MTDHPIGTTLKSKHDGSTVRVVAQPVGEGRWETYVVEGLIGCSGQFPVSRDQADRNWIVFTPQKTLESVLAAGNTGEATTVVAAAAHAGKAVAEAKKTFYLAASSKDLVSVRSRAAELRALGYDWFGGLDWTAWVEANPPEAFHGPLAEMDLAAADEADLFVLVVSDDFSFGAAAEFGARLSAGKVAYVVSRPENKHPFLHHSAVRRFYSWESFVEALR